MSWVQNAVKGRLPHNHSIVSAYDPSTNTLKLTSNETDQFKIDVDLNHLDSYSTEKHEPTMDTLQSAVVCAYIGEDTGILRYDSEEIPEFWIEINTKLILEKKSVQKKKGKKRSANDIMIWKKIMAPPESTLVVWPGTPVKDSDVEEVIQFFQNAFNIQPTLVGCVTTLPDKDDAGCNVPETGGRHDFFFYINNSDMGKFALKRFQFGMRWWEDVFFNKGEDIYPPDFITAYPNPV